MEKKKFIFLESNTTGTGKLLLNRAFAKGFSPILLTKNPKKYSFLPLVNTEVVVLDTSNKDFLFEYLSEIKNLVGLYSSSDSYIEIASWLAYKLGLPHTNPQATKLCRDKYSFYQTLISFGIKTPHTVRIYSSNEAQEIFAKSPFPFVVKPSSGTGSIGVKLCHSNTGYLQYIDSLFRNNHHAILIQEFIEGVEFSVEACSISGKHHIIGITKKYLSALPYFIETGHDFPAVLSHKEEQLIKDEVTNLLSVLHFDFGFSHTEFRIKNGQVFFIEVNPRLAGGMIPVLIEKATGMDLLDILLDLYTNHSVNLKQLYMKFASIRHFISNKTGLIKNIGFKNAKVVEEIQFLKTVGDTFISQGDFRDRLAYIIITDSKAEDCKKRADQALQNFNIDIKSQ